ncbi:hypothetical protein EVA_18292 [gut metagenome]|uniref:Uncharacterized protein n=1 Tax=gut metagenome TaxID=749906 RepID=J9G215_9ZZZZ
MSAAAPVLGEQERQLILSRLLSPILYEEMKAFIRLESSPIVELVPQLERTHKFQYRVKKLIKFLLKVNLLISKRH